MTLRATRQFVEILANGDGKIRATRQFVEMLSIVNGAIERTISQDLIFSQDISVEINTQSAQDLIFEQVLEYEGPLSKTIEDSLIFGDTTDYTRGWQRSPTQTFNFSQQVDVQPFATEIIQNVLFTQSASIPRSEILEQSFIFGQQASGNFVSFIQNVLFIQTAGVGKIIPSGIDREATSSLIFSQSVDKTLILVGAVACDVAQSLNFTQYAGFPKEKTAQQFILFSQIVDSGHVILVEQDLLFNQSISINFVRPRIAISGLIFQHSFWIDLPASTCQYDPVFGGSSDPDAPIFPVTAPTLTRKDRIKLFYPIVMPTMAVEIRAPLFGDRDRLHKLRIQRESRGGTLQVFADPTWPKQQILALTFEGLTEIEAGQIHQFFLNTLGLTVGFTDWEGRTWHGIILTPDEPFIRSRRNIVDISFEFEGELQ